MQQLTRLRMAPAPLLRRGLPHTCRSISADSNFFNATPCQSRRSLSSLHHTSMSCLALQSWRLRTQGLHLHSIEPAFTSIFDHVRFFSLYDSVRRERRNKWMDAAETLASGSAAVASKKPSQLHSFVVNGTEILLSTSPAIPAHSIVQYKGLTEGSAVRGRNALELWRQQLQQQLGGEQQLLHDLLRETRSAALQRLAEAAAAAGANAVVSVRLVTSGLQRMHVEYTAYGTAVRVAKPSAALSP